MPGYANEALIGLAQAQQTEAGARVQALAGAGGESGHALIPGGNRPPPGPGGAGGPPTLPGGTPGSSGPPGGTAPGQLDPSVYAAFANLGQYVRSLTPAGAKAADTGHGRPVNPVSG